MKIENKIKDSIENILCQNGYTLDSIFLFGSRARGDFEKESDYDILIIIKDNIDIKQKREIWLKVFHQLHENFPLTPFDVIIKTVTDFEYEKDIVNTISNEVYLEGIKL
ncbi:nucleotidyltransferase domain-containing protein [Rosettibacter firmus]|uniref:nucleotidyltransferase domain-containing protein n=1 Tax=Rosettibacter firmus TaxID=3111522 RepID=UPI00336BDD7A